MSATDRTFEAFLFFLKEGTLPLWYETHAHVEFENATLNLFQVLTENFDYDPVAKYLTTLAELLQEEPPAQRLVTLFNREIVMTVLAFLMRQHGGLDPDVIQTTYKEISSIIKKKRTSVAGKIWLRLDVWLIQKIAIPGGNPKSVIAEWMGEIIYRFYQDDPQYILKSIKRNRVLKQYWPIPLPVPDLLGTFIVTENPVSQVQEEMPWTPPSEIKKDTDANPTPEYGTTIGNAGLVILAPFLEVFFKTGRILEGSIVRDKDRGLGYLHFMVYGNHYYREYDMLLGRILCGVEMDQPVGIVQKLSIEQRKRSDDLLRTVIENWSALKNTSLDGLREGFLQRKGILTFHDDHWQLKVEQQAQDILLDSLPWAIAHVKLPWMQNTIQTQWT